MDVYYSRKICIAIEKIEKHLGAIEDALRKRENRTHYISDEETKSEEQKEEE